MLHVHAYFQFKNDEKVVFGFVIQDTKEELATVGVKFDMIDSFYSDFIKAADKRTVSKSIHSKKGDISFIKSDFSYLDTETKVEIYDIV